MKTIRGENPHGEHDERMRAAIGLAFFWPNNFTTERDPLPGDYTRYTWTFAMPFSRTPSANKRSSFIASHFSFSC